MAVGPPKRKSKEGNVMKEMQKSSTRKKRYSLLFWGTCEQFWKKGPHFYFEALATFFGNYVKNVAIFFTAPPPPPNSLILSFHGVHVFVKLYFNTGLFGRIVSTLNRIKFI